MANILVVEDDIDIAQGIAEFLETKEHELDFAYTGKQALALLEENHYQLVLLDINLPFINGYDICRHLSDGDDDIGKHLARVPVIMMSSRSHEKDVIEGFQSGAWDYLKKPFSFSELSARIDVGLLHSTSTPKKTHTLQYQGVSLNTESLSFSYQDSSVQLHEIGFEIVKLLVTSAPNAVKTSKLHQHIWPHDTPESDPLRAHIYKLRKQLTEHYGKTFIETVKGVGYRLAV
ncbi:MAG: response regulator transcription factor [Cellvibrionaceae bacterium]